MGIIGTIWRYICFYVCPFYNMAYFFLIFVGWSQVSEEHEICKETQQKGAEEDAGQQCQAGCSAEKGLMWFKTTEPVFLMACMLQHFYKNKIGHNKVFTSWIWEPSKSLELYFRCQLCIKPVCGDQRLFLFLGRSSQPELWRGFVLILSAAPSSVLLYCNRWYRSWACSSSKSLFKL